jgi:putative hydrolase of the HAD superfamily
VSRQPVRAVFFDVDFTLIYPGPMFQGEGYAQFCARHGMRVAPERFSAAVRAASSILDAAEEHIYNDAIFIAYTGRIIEEMGGSGPAVFDCAAEIYREWATCHHFRLYDDVVPALRALAARSVKVGLISNSHRSLASFLEHFELQGLIAAAMSSSEHGYLKPHPSIFEAALRQLEVGADEAMMVGDSLAHDIEGATRVGMRGLLVLRSQDEPFARGTTEVPVIRNLSEVVEHL